jgi:hypothetical protein
MSRHDYTDEYMDGQLTWFNEETGLDYKFKASGYRRNMYLVDRDGNRRSDDMCRSSMSDHLSRLIDGFQLEREQRAEKDRFIAWVKKNAPEIYIEGWLALSKREDEDAV